MPASLSVYKLALVQLNSTPQVERNLELAEKAITEAAANGAELIGLPECSPFLGPENLLIEKIELIEHGFFDLLERLSRDLGVAVFAGGYRRALPSTKSAKEGSDASYHSTQKVYNCLYFIDPKEKIKKIYDKIHLFDVDIPDGVRYEESRYIQAGKTPVVLKHTPYGNLGFSICYDLRFPEMYRQMSRRGADTFLIPAAFTAYTGRAHWHSLIRARAIENLSYVFAPAQTGLHFGKRKSFGHSMVVSPWGEVLAGLEDAPGICYAEISSERIAEARKQIPSIMVEPESILHNNP